jgi:recombination protein RecT
MTTEIKKAKPQGLKELINSDSMREQFARALPKHLSPERFSRVAITALSRTPKLMECTPSSLMKCLLDLSAMGLEPDGRRAHLIPYNNRKQGTVECQLIVDYKGLVELIRRSGDVVSLRAETVCEKDLFTWKNGEIDHVINWRGNRGKVEAVYAEAVMKSGERQTAVMTHEEVEAIRKRSRSQQDSPWTTDWAEMAKKTVVRRLSKMLPLSSEIMDHVSKDDDQYSMRNVTPAAAPASVIDPFLALPPAPKDEAPVVNLTDMPEADWGDEKGGEA